MEEEESTVGKNKLTSIPANYVSLAQLQERWIKEKEREKNEQEQLQKEKERQEHEIDKNEQERLQRQKQRQEKSDKEFRKREPPRKRLNRRREVQQGKDEQRPEAVLSITTADVGENGTNNGSLKAKRKTLDPQKKKNLRGVDKEHIAVGTQEPPATSTVREERRRPQRMKEGTSKDSTLGVEGSFSRLSFNHSDRRQNDGHMKYSSRFKGGYYSGQFARNGKVSNTDRAPVSMMWVKKGSVGDTDGDACETRSLNKVVN